jgi:hypothetical protein
MGHRTVEKMASYIITVKTEYLSSASLHHAQTRDYKEVQKEFANFNR